MSKPVVFTEHEQDQFRADIASARVPGAYEPGRWSVSPLNRDAAAAFPRSVRLRDVSIRGMESMPGSLISADEKRELMQSLVRAGVTDLSSGSIIGRSLSELTADVDAVKSVNLDVRFSCPLVRSIADVDLAAEAGFDAVQAWMPPWGPASLIYEVVHPAAWSGAGWKSLGLPEDRAGFLARAVSLTKYARSLGLSVTVPMLMVSYLTDERLNETADALGEADATEIALFDGPGGMGPEAYAELVGRLRALLPQIDIGLHPHNTFGLGVANALAAVRAGANVVEVSINGYCGGPGNADLSSTVAAFEALYGVSTGIDSTQLNDLSRRAERLTGYEVAWNHPVTGHQAFTWGGRDFLSQEVNTDSLLHNAIDPEWVGAKRPALITPESGPFTMWDKLEQLGIEPDRELVERVLAEAVAWMRAKGSLISDDTLVELVNAK